MRLASFIFIRRLVINKSAHLRAKGPLLIASNHPNSFLDAVILDILFKEPVWSLARGDAFINKSISNILRAVRILPVYRTSEGVENLSANYETFDACIGIFRNKGVVQIFSEGFCVNEWHLRPLKKGTARLAISAWEKKIPLRVLPVGINYSSFRRFGKNLFINFGDPINPDQLDWTGSEGNRIQSFNANLQRQLGNIVYEIGHHDIETQKRLLERRPSMAARILLAIPAMVGWLLHAPLYLPLRSYAMSKYAHTDHYDAVMIALLVFLYPIYLLILMLIIGVSIHPLWAFVLPFLFVMCARATIELKGQLDKK